MGGIDYIKLKIEFRSDGEEEWIRNIITHVFYEETKHAVNKCLSRASLSLEDELQKIISLYKLEEPFRSWFLEDRENFLKYAKDDFDKKLYRKNTPAWSTDIFDTFYDGESTKMQNDQQR